MIKLSGSGLPIMIRNCNHHVTDFDMNVVLLGLDVLDLIGFNFSQYIQENYHRIKLLDINDPPRTLAAYKGVKYGKKKMTPLSHRSTCLLSLGTTPKQK